MEGKIVDMIRFTKNTKIENDIINKINELAQDNIYLNSIMYQINNDDLLINISMEDELLNDVHNKTKTLTQYRAYTIGNKMNIFYTRYENASSLLFILFHELCHYILGRDLLTSNLIYLLNGGYYKDKGIINDFKSNYELIPNYEQLTTKDEIHESLIEEKLCDYFAKTIVGEDYSRQWWRENIKKVNDDNKYISK